MPTPALPTPTFFVEALPPPTPVPTPDAPPAPTPTPNPLFNLSEGVFTVAWLSDTQHYAYKAPEIFEAMTRFLRDEREKMNLLYVVHTGDFVDDRDDAAQWENAMRAMESLEGIPYGVLGGNHDVGTSEQDFSVFSSCFGEKAMEKRPGSDAYYGGSYKDNRGHYDLVDIGANRYVFAYMGYAPDSGAVAWLNRVFKEHRDRIGVLCVHDYFKTDMTYSDAGATLLKKVVKKNPNVYLVMCGHRYTVGHKSVEFDDDGDGATDRRAYELIQNYQAAGELGGSGYLQLLQFDDIKKELRLISYSPYTDDRRYYDTPGTELEKYYVNPENEEYSFSYPWE
ncbi:MAG: metallophosphoesterase [Clostridiaceae bacterium]|nr:metallophosphoesterase [Eubacteriales bacterium]